MDISGYILAVPRISYWLALVDHGPRIGIGLTLSSGNPEATRKDIIDEVRTHIARGGCVVHVRHVDGTDMEDVTQEILEEAVAQLMQAAE